MGKAGRWITGPKAGAYCTIRLDSGEKIVVNHRVFASDLDTEEGKTALRFLTRDATERSLDATPLGAFVKYVQSSETDEEVEAGCRSLLAIR